MTEPDRSNRWSSAQDYLKQIVYGGNDGIVTTFAIVAGFAGAQIEGAGQIGALTVLVFGLANLFADGVSMGLGEFLSLRSRHALYGSRRARMRQEHDTLGTAHGIVPTLEQAGLSTADAQTLAHHLASHPDLATDLRMSLDHGMASPDKEKPALSGFVTFIAFLLFGALPLIPYFSGAATRLQMGLSVIMTLTALVILGLMRWRVTEDGLARAVGETVLVGAVCSLVAYLVGYMVTGGA